MLDPDLYGNHCRFDSVDDIFIPVIAVDPFVYSDYVRLSDTFDFPDLDFFLHRSVSQR